MTQSLIAAACTATTAALCLNTYLHHGHNFPTLVAVVLAVAATGLSLLSALWHRRSAPPAQ
jgi:hypothetical protein